MFLVVLVLGMLSHSSAQNRTIRGKISDEKGSPMSGVTISGLGTRITTLSTADGAFAITVPQSCQSLTISAVGFANQNVSIGNKATISVTLRSTEVNLDEVVVVGYQSLNKKDVTGAVASISGSEVAQKPIGSFTQLLQGKAPGLQVTGQSGRPGANSFIRIRGAGSINASSEPLFIVDGIPVTVASYNMINPNDIETFTVLKDAASAAVYGARAANGVIVITTKKGKNGKSEVTYSFQYGLAQRQSMKNLQLMSNSQKLQLEFEGGYVNPILDSMIINRIGTGALPTGSTLFTISQDQRQALWNLVNNRGPVGGWEPALLRDAITKTHQITLNGSGDKFKYYFSLNKSDNEGILYGSYWNRTTGRMNIEYMPNSWFKLGSNLNVAFTKENQVREPFNAQNANASIYLINPYEPIRLDNGRYNPTFQGFNPLEGADFNPQELKRVAAFSTIFGEIKPIKELTIKSQLGINFNMLNEEYYLQPGSNLATLLGYNQKRVQANQDYLYVFTNTANWKKIIGNNHSVSVLVGTEFTKDKVYNTLMQARGFPTASVNTLDNASTPFTTSTTRTDWSLISYFSNVTYDYKRKYFLSLSGRRDGSSRFGKNVQFANFWGVGLAWDVLAEDFIKLNALNGLKLRVSYGTAGNNNIGNYDALGTYALNARYNNQSAAIPARLQNESLTWEQNENYDIGLDVSLLDSRVNAKFDYYYRKTKDLLYPVNVSTTTGFGSFTGNIGSLKNSGFELQIDGDVIRRKDFNWNVGITYSNNDNKILSLYSDDQVAAASGGIGRLRIGHPVNNFFMNRWAGVNPADGKNIYYDKNGATTSTFNSGDAILLEGKSPNVKYFGSLNTSLQYKGVEFSMQFYYSGGNYIMNYIWQTGANNGEDLSIPQFTEAANYWKKPGDNTFYTNLSDPTQRQTFNDDRWLQKGDYISLRDVTLSYTLPQYAIKQLKFVKSLRVFVQGTNLWIGTKFKGIPEVGQSNSESAITVPGIATLYGFPQLKAFTFGIDVKF